MAERSEYDRISETYAKTRWALPWISAAISDNISPDGVILDLGCGTGDYVQSVKQKRPDGRFHGVDLSRGMIAIAFEKCPKANWIIADIDRVLPYQSDSFDHLFSVNVMHHLTNYKLMFQQIHRVLKQEGTALIFTDSGDDIHARSQTKYFPETLEFNIRRYPTISFLKTCADEAGLRFKGETVVSGELELDERMMQLVEQKSLSELRALSNPAFQAGLKRIREDRLQGARWRSQLTMLSLQK